MNVDVSPKVLSVGHTDEVQVLGQGQAVGHVELVVTKLTDQRPVSVKLHDAATAVAICRMDGRTHEDNTRGVKGR